VKDLTQLNDSREKAAEEACNEAKASVVFAVDPEDDTDSDADTGSNADSDADSDTTSETTTDIETDVETDTTSDLNPGECRTEKDCQLVNDCCSCLAIGTDQKSPSCELEECFALTCEAYPFRGGASANRLYPGEPRT